MICFAPTVGGFLKGQADLLGNQRVILLLDEILEALVLLMTIDGGDAGMVSSLTL